MTPSASTSTGATPSAPPAPHGSPVTGRFVRGEGFGWSQGATRNYLALSSVICGAVALVLASLILGILAGALAILAGRWAAAHNGVGGPLANLGFLRGLLAMVSNILTSTMLTSM